MKGQDKMRYAINTCDIDAIRDARDAGFDYVEVPVKEILRPGEPKSAFEDAAAKFRDAGLPVETHNIFLSGPLVCVGPEATHDAIEEFAATCFERMAELGSKTMVFGSGWARAIPEGWPRANAAEQFTALLARLGALAAGFGVELVVEPLARVECNFVNTVDEGAAIARASGSPAVGVLADSFHWERNGEGADTILAARDRLRHAHVATAPNRRVPGVEPYDFSPFFKALRAAGYDGRVTIESSIAEPAGRVEAFAKALEILKGMP